MRRDLTIDPHPAGFASSRRRLLVVRASWIAAVVVALGLFAAAIAALYVQRSAPPEPVRAGLEQLGLPVGFYAAYWSAVLVVFAVACCTVAAVIAWRKPVTGLALLVSLFLVLLGVANAPNMQALVEVYPALNFPAQCLLFLTYACLMLFLCLFPDGHFVPRSTRPFALAWLGSIPVVLLLTGDSLSDPGGVWIALLILGGLPAGAVAQIYRYARVSDPLERQQTKWVVFGISVAVAGQVVFPLLTDLFPSLTRPGAAALLYDLADFTGITLTYLFIPLTIGIAVLRYRLWDIDLVVNRTLVYGALTAAIVGVYVLVVGGFGALLQARGNLLISLLATGLVAVLFAPLRDRLQRGVNRLMYGERDEPYAVLSRLGARLEATLEPEAVLPAVVETVAQALKLPYAAIAIREHDGGITVAAARGSPVDSPIRVPLVYQHETIGQLLLAPRAGEDGFSPADRRLLDDLARQAGVAAHAVRLTADLQRARERLVSAREEERRRLRRDLHDGLGPQLSSQTLTIDAALKLLKRDPGAAEALLLDLKAQAQDAISDIRRLVYALRPPALDDLGLLGAIRETAAQYGRDGLRVSFEAPEELPPLPAAVEVAAYRIAQEALTNAVRHADACACAVSLAIDDNVSALCLEVRDDGKGIEVDRGTGVGLPSMRERATELGGSLIVDSLPEEGTVVRARLPLPEGGR